MNQIEKAINDLSSPDKDTRYKACVELRLADSLPESAIMALEAATHDPDPLVADAARRALAIHMPSPSPTELPFSGNEESIREDAAKPGQNTWNIFAIVSLVSGLLSVSQIIFFSYHLIESQRYSADGSMYMAFFSSFCLVNMGFLALVTGIIAVIHYKKCNQLGKISAITGLVIGSFSLVYVPLLFYLI